jgi:hypothetical protein
MSIGLSVLIVLNWVGLIPHFGIGWGNGVRATGYELWVDKAIGFRSATGMNSNMPGGMVISVQTLGRWNVGGVEYHRWSLVCRTQSGTLLPGTYGTFTDVTISLIGPLLLTLGVLCWSVWRLATQRAFAQGSQICRNCGYDLRATPDRCPECGRVPSESAAGVAKR